MAASAAFLGARTCSLYSCLTARHSSMPGQGSARAAAPAPHLPHKHQAGQHRTAALRSLSANAAAGLATAFLPNLHPQERGSRSGSETDGCNSRAATTSACAYSLLFQLCGVQILSSYFRNVICWVNICILEQGMEKAPEVCF